MRLALFFLVVSLIAALFGFGGISAAAADIARILFFIAIVIFLVLLVACLFLFRSMSGRIKRLPASFDVPSDNGKDKGNGKDRDKDKAVSSPDVVDLP